MFGQVRKTSRKGRRGFRRFNNNVRRERFFKRKEIRGRNKECSEDFLIKRGRKLGG